MTTWTERAKAHFLQERQEQADKTDETPLSSVSSVCAQPVYEKSSGVSSVSSVCSRPVCEKEPTDDEYRLMRKGMAQHRAERIIKMLAHRDAALDGLLRSCAECSSYYAGRCLKRLQPVGACDDIADVLHRCPGFSE